MKSQNLVESVKLPENVQLEISGDLVKVKGPKGDTQKKIIHPRVAMKKEGNEVKLMIKNPDSYERAIIYSLKAHLKNLIDGVLKGFTYNLKICSGHFPMTVKADGDKVVVSNFLGEKIPRKADIIKGVNVKCREIR